jgi:hypothetical protein
LHHQHFELPLLRDDLLSAMSFPEHLLEILSKLIVSISPIKENPVRSAAVTFGQIRRPNPIVVK